MDNLFCFSPFLLLLNCLFLFIFRRWFGPIGTFYNSIMTFAFFIYLSWLSLSHILKTGGYYFLDLGRWFFCLNWIDSHFIFCFDILSLVAGVLVAGLTMLALYFGVEYMYREAFINRLLYLLNLFATSVIWLFFCYDLFLILIIWECIGLFSLLLVNFYSTRIYTMKAALKTFVFSRISDFFMFLFFILTVLFFNTTDLSLIFLQIPFLTFNYLFFNSLALHFLSLYSLTLALSGVIKSAQFFFHVWLPDAMEAPTPASALIHSSTLVVAGIFLILRFAILFEFTPITNYFLAILGSGTLAFASITAIVQNDIKKLVAYSTISQIGYLVCGCGFTCYNEVLIYLFIHAVNKAFLFILVGYFVHFFNGNTDLRQMGSSYLYSLDMVIFLLGVSINLFGLPYSAGFFGKEFLIFQFFCDDWIATWVRICWIVSFFCTPCYMLLLFFVVSFGSKRSSWQAYNGSNRRFNQEKMSLFDMNEDVSLTFSRRMMNRVLGKTLQWGAVTSRATTWVLFGSWFFIFYYGELLLGIILDFATLSELIPVANFFLIQAHFSFDLALSSSWMEFGLTWVLWILLISSLNFILNLKFASQNSFFNQVSLLELFLFFTIFFYFGNILGFLSVVCKITPLLLKFVNDR